MLRLGAIVVLALTPLFLASLSNPSVTDIDTLDAAQERQQATVYKAIRSFCPYRHAYLFMISLLVALSARPGIALSADISGNQPRSGSSIAAVAKQVYRLHARGDDVIKSGTAFLVSGKRVIATSHHVVDQTKIYMLGYVDARGLVHHVGLRLLANYPQKDLALLEALSDLPGDALSLATDPPEFGSDLFAIGYPAAADLGLEGQTMQSADPNLFLPSVVKGTVSRIMTGAWLTNQLQHQAPITQGYSGGPLVESGGVVVGVSSAVHKEASGISYGVAASDLVSLLAACSLPLRQVQLSLRAAPAPSIAVPPPEGNESLPAADRALLKRANDMLKRGDVVRARYLFEYLAREKQLPTAYEGLAKTYDPSVLNELTIGGIMADAGKAREFYDKARQPDQERRSAQGASAAPRCNKSFCALSQRGDVPVLTCQ